MEFKTLGIQLGASYYGSDVVVADGSPEPEDSPTKYVASTRPGGRLPHVWLEPGRSTLDEVGSGLTLFSLGYKPAGDAWREAATAVGVALKFVDLTGSDAKAIFGSGLFLVRPDQHIAWRDKQDPENITNLLQTVLGLNAKKQ
jgi:hypothetical protein